MQTNKAKAQPSEIFEAAIRSQKLTHIDVAIYIAEHQQAIKDMEPPAAIQAIKNVIKRLFVSYGINPSQAFSDEAFKSMYLEEVLRMISTYHPTLTEQAFQLAVELNVVDHWNNKVELFGSNISVNFLMQVLKIYKESRGKRIQACEKYLEAIQQPMPASMDAEELRDMLYADASMVLAGTGQLRLPTIYYRYLVDVGELQETDENLSRWLQAGKQVAASLKSAAHKKTHTPLNLKELGTAREMIRSTSPKDLAMDAAVQEWVHNIYSKMIPA